MEILANGNWRKYVMVACGLIAVLLDALPPQMLVPITPAWLGWCDMEETTASPNDDATSSVATIVIAMPSANVTTMTPAVKTMQTLDNESSSTSEYLDSSSQVLTPSYNVSVTENMILLSNKSCSKSDFDPRISLVYLAAGPVEVIASPLVAILCKRYGSSGLLLFGLVSTAFIDIPFAYGSGFLAYLLVRVGINVVTAITEVSYLHMTAQIFADDDIKRARFLGLYSTVLGFDYFGPTFSGVLYDKYDQAFPFLSLLVIGLVTALVFFIFGLNCKIRNTNADDPSISETEQKTDIPYLSLFKDPYVIVVFVVVFLTILPKAMMAPFISLWLMDAFDATPWEIGVVYFPGFIAYILSTILGERLLSKFPDHAWAFGAVFLTLDGIAVIFLPFTPNIISFSAIFTFQIASATITSFTLFPMFLKIADVRYDCPNSSSIHGFSFMAVGLAYFLGPMFASELFKHIGFKFLNIGVGSLHLLMVPFVTILRFVKSPTGEVNEETYLVTCQETTGTTELQSYDLNGR